jgi:hypothetical protein
MAAESAAVVGRANILTGEKMPFKRSHLKTGKFLNILVVKMSYY